MNKEFGSCNLRTDKLERLNLTDIMTSTKEKTIMDVMGNNRDENVCSNLLAFYFNPKEEHELENLVLKALIDVLMEKNILTDFKYENIAITRELKTLNGNRMDIVIKNDDYVIGIENKIDAALYNDLNDYAKTLEEISSNAIKIVLSVKEVDTNYDETGFINITYPELLDSLEKLMQNYEYKDKKWYLYLEDFVMNFSRSHIEYNMKKSLLEENTTLENPTEYYNNEINNKIEELAKQIKENKFDRKEVKIGENLGFDLTTYILLNGYNLDARLTANGWWIGTNVYTNKKIFDVKAFLSDNNIKIEHESERTFMGKIL